MSETSTPKPENRAGRRRLATPLTLALLAGTLLAACQTTINATPEKSSSCADRHSFCDKGK
ncbi:MAG: hypothetical protein QF893_18565 [Alphaproteobacteria bacterium]|jgi:hypothetical protein|nr:hypothetical protein [Alphaproteobacteria bacterium]